MAKGRGDPKEPEPVVSRLESHMPLMLRWRGTVINKIWWHILLVVIYTACIVSINRNVLEAKIKFPYVLIQLMGVVCGLLLVFRTNTAYDRYWEGRKTWSTMTQGIRTLTRLIWVNVKEESSKDIVEKKSAINLLVGFAVATKHYLREEYSYDEEDLLTVTRHIHHFHTPSSVKPISKQSQQDVQSTTNLDQQPPPPPTTPLPGEEEVIELKTKRKGRIVKTQSSTASIRSHKSDKKTYKFRAHDVATPTNIPIELSYYIMSYINWLKVRDRCDSGTLGAMSAALNSMVECLTTFERILRTPIPMAYSVHLHQSIWIYILALPFQLVGGQVGLEWWTVLIVGITSFFLLGILGIGWEIENPFGYDDNDLPLDDFCKVLRREIEVIVSQRPLDPAEWIFTSENQPFAPENTLNAVELSEKPVDEMMEIIVNRGSQINLNHPFGGGDNAEFVDGKKRKEVKKRKGGNPAEKFREEEEKMIP